MDKIGSDITISVIIPVYNSQDYLDTCICSVINQTHKNIEIIIIDDGSTDSSASLCDAYAAKDSRVHVIHKQNEGLVSARKLGIEKAQGEYISFVDSDDYIEHDMYEIVMQKLDTKNPDIVLYDLVEEYPDHSCVKRNHFLEGYYTKDVIKKIILPSMLSYGDFFNFGILPNLVCKMIKREFIRNVYLAVDKCITVGEDAAYTFQLLPQVEELMIITYAPYHYCKRYDSMMWKETDLYRIKALKENLEHSFSRLGINEIMATQLKRYISFVTLLKAPFELLKNSLPFSNPKSKIALYGAGGMGQAVYNAFSNIVTIWVDKKAAIHKQYGISVKEVDSLLCSSEDYDVVFIAILSSDTCGSISMQLREKGIKKKIYYFDGEAMKCI